MNKNKFFLLIAVVLILMGLPGSGFAQEETPIKTELIDFGWIYYGLTRRRIRVDLTEELRETVYRSAKEMRDCFRRKHTPRVKTHKGCRTCSLADLCLPELLSPNMDSEAYIRRHLEMD